jgi:hypothetical protein
MMRPTEPWTIEDLELFLDDELAEPRRSALAETLLHDVELRRRLAAVKHLDDLVCDALSTEAIPRCRPRIWRIAHPGPALAAACLLVAVAGVWWSLSTHPQRPADRLVVELPSSLSPNGQHTEEPYDAMRVVLSLPVSPTVAARRQVIAHRPGVEGLLMEKNATTAADTDVEFLTRVARALQTGSTEQAVHLLDGATDVQRVAAVRYVADLLQSAYVAEQILDRFSPQEQVAVCGYWARRPLVRSVAFTRLRRLADDVDLSREVQEVIAGMIGDPALESWLRGFQLVDRDFALRNLAG